VLMYPLADRVMNHDKAHCALPTSDTPKYFFVKGKCFAVAWSASQDTGRTRNPDDLVPIPISQDRSSFLDGWATRRSAIIHKQQTHNPGETAAFTRVLRSWEKLGRYLGGVLFSSFLVQTHAQPIPAPNSTVESDWRAHAGDSMTKILESLASLLGPLIVFAIFVTIAIKLLDNVKEGKSILGLLGTAAIFITIVPDGELYMRLALGASHGSFAVAYCRLVFLQNKEAKRWDKGYCTLALLLALLMTMIPVLSVPVQAYWIALTNKADPLFAVVPFTPLAFAVCDLAAHIQDALYRL
jgi:hypothetical protein